METPLCLCLLLLLGRAEFLLWTYVLFGSRVHFVSRVN
uniref:Uncharacterized protein n=1 Tax=Mus musculus TaxID=10090 RepID=Q3UNP1_MOUSE|nr:unnamed protein product [Mus musculus]